MAILGIFFHEMLGEKAVNIKLHAMPGGEGGVSKQFHADLEKFSIWGGGGPGIFYIFLSSTTSLYTNTFKKF